MPSKTQNLEQFSLALSGRSRRDGCSLALASVEPLEGFAAQPFGVGDRLRLRPADLGLGLGEHLLDRVPVGGIRRQVGERGPARSTAVATPATLWLVRRPSTVRSGVSATVARRATSVGRGKAVAWWRGGGRRPRPSARTAGRRASPTRPRRCTCGRPPRTCARPGSRPAHAAACPTRWQPRRNFTGEITRASPNNASSARIKSKLL
jgi:hypothetical protein